MKLQTLKNNNSTCVEYLQNLIDKGFKTVKEVIEMEEGEVQNKKIDTEKNLKTLEAIAELRGQSVTEVWKEVCKRAGVTVPNYKRDTTVKGALRNERP